MEAAMTSCSSAILGIERFTSAYARQVHEQVMALIQSRSLELHYQNLQNFSIQWKQTFIFRIKSEHMFRRKRQKHASFMDDVKNKEH